MRVISGKFKGRKIIAPSNLPVRPTTDQAKESLFNVLANDIDFNQVSVLDLFAGTGNISMEFLSRGAVKVVSVDANQHCFNFNKKLKEQWNLDNYFPYKNDVFRSIKNINEQFDIVFADPPYQMPNISELPKLLLSSDLFKENGLLIIEHGKDTVYEHPFLLETRVYGSVNFSFFSK